MGHEYFFKFASILLFLILLSLIPPHYHPAIAISIPQKVVYLPHSPILITSNQEFIQENGVVGGNGTVEDPYVIENWEIVTHNETAITVISTNVHFVIRNCLIKSNSGYGIFFGSIRNGTVMNTTLETEEMGIYVRSSSRFRISNNSFIGCRGGGIYFEGEIGYFDISENTFVNCGCSFSPQVWFHDEYFKSNFVNGKELYWARDRRNFTIHHDVGQIILNNCTNYIIENQTIENTSEGIVLYRSPEGIVRNNTIKNTKYGIRSVDVPFIQPGNVIDGNIVEKSSVGVLCSNSNKNMIANNTFYDCEYGVILYISSNCRIYRNIFGKCGYGLLFSGQTDSPFSSDNNMVSENCFIESQKANVFLFGVACGRNNTFFLNSFMKPVSGTYVEVSEGYRGKNWWNGTERGNFWDDWREPDDNEDGIVDIPFSVGDTGEMDFYPLVSPPSITIFHIPKSLVNPLVPLSLEVRVLASKYNISKVMCYYRGNCDWNEKELIIISGSYIDGTYMCTIHLENLSLLSYYFLAVDEGGCIETSQVFESKIMSRSSFPLNLSALGGADSLLLRWDPPTYTGFSTVLCYNIYRGLSMENKTLIATVDANTTTFVDTNVTPGLTYYYHVTAVNAIGESEPSNTVCVTVPLAKLTAKILVAKSNLRSGEEIETRVVVADAETGEPVENATVTLSTQLPGKFESQAGQTDENGTFTTKFVAGNVNASVFGKLVANISAEHYENATTSILLGILPGEMKISVEIDKTAVKVGENFTVVVSVKDENGDCVEDASVEILVGQDGAVAGEYQKFTNAEGRAVFTFSALKEGNLVFQVVAKKEGYAEARSGVGVWIKAVPEQGIDFGIPFALLLIAILIVGIWEERKGRQKISSN
ncbi:MAG: NosD domain-containing protein [Thermoplasmata archaeon]